MSYRGRVPVWLMNVNGAVNGLAKKDSEKPQCAELSAEAAAKFSTAAAALLKSQRHVALQQVRAQLACSQKVRWVHSLLVLRKVRWVHSLLVLRR